MIHIPTVKNKGIQSEQNPNLNIVHPFYTQASVLLVVLGELLQDSPNVAFMGKAHQPRSSR